MLCGSLRVIVAGKCCSKSLANPGKRQGLLDSQIQKYEAENFQWKPVQGGRDRAATKKLVTTTSCFPRSLLLAAWLQRCSPLRSAQLRRLSLEVRSSLLFFHSRSGAFFLSTCSCCSACLCGPYIYLRDCGCPADCSASVQHLPLASPTCSGSWGRAPMLRGRHGGKHGFVLIIRDNSFLPYLGADEGDRADGCCGAGRCSSCYSRGSTTTSPLCSRGEGLEFTRFGIAFLEAHPSLDSWSGCHGAAKRERHTRSAKKNFGPIDWKYLN